MNALKQMATHYTLKKVFFNKEGYFSHVPRILTTDDSGGGTEA